MAQRLTGTVDSANSSASLVGETRLDASGSLIGDFDPVTNPGGTLTRPGFFGGSGNNPIPASASFTVTADLSANPVGSLSLEPNFGTLTIGLDGLALDLLDGTPAATALSASLLFSSFNTTNPGFIYPGGTPFSLPLGDAASITRAELTQTAPTVGILTATADPDVFEFAAVLPVRADLTVRASLPGAEPIENPLDPVPLLVPVSGTLTRLADGAVRLEIVAEPTPIVLSTPLALEPLPPVPLELPTLSSATAGVLLTLTPDQLAADATVGLSLVIDASGEVCVADWNADQQVNFFDVLGYIASFNSEDPSADLAAPAGVFNFFDLTAFLAEFNAGCSNT
jgi:hypothetical protein